MESEENRKLSKGTYTTAIGNILVICLVLSLGVGFVKQVGSAIERSLECTSVRIIQDGGEQPVEQEAQR